MKISLFLKCTLLTLLICCFSAASQDYTHLGLPDGAIARLGKGELGQIHFSPDGSVLAVSSSVGIWFHNPQTGKELSLLVCPEGVTPFAFAYAPDGKMIAVGSTNKMMVITGKRKARLRSTAGNIVQLRDITTGEKKTTLKLQTQKAASIAYSPDGNTIATGSTDGTVQFWDAITQEHKSTFTTHTDIVSVVYSPDGDTIATRSTDGTVLLWKIKPTSEAE